jgi:hypothetical protein
VRTEPVPKLNDYDVQERAEAEESSFDRGLRGRELAARLVGQKSGGSCANFTTALRKVRTAASAAAETPFGSIMTGMLGQ